MLYLTNGDSDKLLVSSLLLRCVAHFLPLFFIKKMVSGGGGRGGGDYNENTIRNMGRRKSSVAPGRGNLHAQPKGPRGLSNWAIKHATASIDLSGEEQHRCRSVTATKHTSVMRGRRTKHTFIIVSGGVGGAWRHAS